jgi:hypothetical protein
MADESYVEGIAKGFLSSFLGSFLGSAVAKDVSSLIVEFTASGLESLGVKAVNHLRERGNHDLEKLILGSFLISLKETIKFPPRKSPSTKSQVERLRIQLAKNYGQNPDDSNSECTMSLHQSLMTGVPEDIESEALSLLVLLSTDFNDYVLEDGTPWNLFLAEVAGRFLPSFKEAYKDDNNFARGRLAFERDMAWSTQQAVASLSDSIADLTAAQNTVLESVRIGLTEISENVRSLGDWTSLIGVIDTRTSETLRVVKSIYTENQATSMRFDEGLNAIQSSVEATRELASFFEQERNELREVFRDKSGVTVGHVLRGLCSYDDQVRASAAYHAGNDRVVESIPLLRANLSHPKEAVRLFSVQSLGFLKDASSVDVLLHMAENDISSVIRSTCVASLSNIGYASLFSQKNLNLWISWASDPNEFRRQTAIYNLYFAYKDGLIDLRPQQDLFVSLQQVESVGHIADRIKMLIQTNDSAVTMRSISTARPAMVAGLLSNHQQLNEFLDVATQLSHAYQDKPQLICIRTHRDAICSASEMSQFVCRRLSATPFVADRMSSLDVRILTSTLAKRGRVSIVIGRSFPTWLRNLILHLHDRKEINATSVSPSDSSQPLPEKCLVVLVLEDKDYGPLLDNELAAKPLSRVDLWFVLEP